RQRRRGQQDRYLWPGHRRPRARREVHGGGADLDHRLGDRDGRRDPDREPARRRAAVHAGAAHRRRGRGGLESGIRRHAGRVHRCDRHRKGRGPAAATGNAGAVARMMNDNARGRMMLRRIGLAVLAGVGLLLSAASAAPAAANQGGRPMVVFSTNHGDFTIELYPDKAPITVENFLSYVDAGFYDNTIFHRVIPGFVIQGGGFTEDMRQKPTEAPIKNEADNGLKNERGTLSMARTSDINSATSQFFVNLQDNAFL